MSPDCVESTQEHKVINASDQVYLRREVKLEPLVCGWHAWPHLIAPVQQAMNVVYRQLPLLQSFSQNPHVHISAARDPAMFGGPFVHLGADKVPAVTELLADTKRRAARLIEMGTEIRKLDEQLQKNAKGYSLSEFYTRLPESLKGLVEFLYDINNHPRMRFIEELVASDDPGRETQEIMISTMPEQDRAFFMSTPRLCGQDSMKVQMPFSDHRIDVLSRMRTTAANAGDVARLLDVSAEQWSLFSSFLTTQAPLRKDPDYLGDGVRLRYFGHASVLIQTRSTSILLDPMVALEPDSGDGRFCMSDLPNTIDYVVLSHNHQDHCSPEMLLQLRHRIRTIIVPRNNSGNICDPSMKVLLRSLGFTDVRVVDPFDEIRFAEGAITSLPFPGEHVDLDIHSRHGIHIEILGRRFAFLVDSDGVDPVMFRRIAARIGRKFDALFLGMECHGAPLTWLYGPLLTQPISRKDDESRRLSGLDSARAWNAVQQFSADQIFVYAMGQEPWLKYIMGLQYSPESIQLREVASFIAKCKESGMNASNLFVSKEMTWQAAS